MSRFEPSKWKVGQPTLRVVGVLAVLGAASFVIGGCPKRGPTLARQEALASPDTNMCSDGSEPADAGSLTLQPDGGLDKQALCLKPQAPLEFSNRFSEERTLCVRHQTADGLFDENSTFEGGGTSLTPDAGGSVTKRLHGSAQQQGRQHYGFWVSPDGGCDPVRGRSNTNNGTLEVATGGKGEGPDGGQDGEPPPRR